MKLTIVFAALVEFSLSAASQTQNAPRPLPPLQDARAVYAASKDSIVLIEAKHGRRSQPVQGSGVVIRATGPNSRWIATNAHVVGDAKRVQIRQGKTLAEADVEYVDDTIDLALLYTSDSSHPPARLAATSDVEIGEKVFAIGSPFGLEQTITEGILSGIRTKDGVSLLQSSASISSGNSGGGLFNAKAQLIGITTFKLKQGEALGFSIATKHVADAVVASFSAGLVRMALLSNYARATKFKESVSDTVLAIVESSSFPKWLLHSKSLDGTVYAIEVSRRSDSLDGITELNRYLLGVVRRVNTSWHENTARLQCKMTNRQGAPMAETLPLLVNTELFTVQGQPASVSDSEVRFAFSESLSATLDRNTGELTIGNEQVPKAFSGVCEALQDRSKRKF